MSKKYCPKCSSTSVKKMERKTVDKNTYVMIADIHSVTGSVIIRKQITESFEGI